MAMDPNTNTNLARQREIREQINEIRSQMTGRWDKHEAGDMSIYDVDSGNADDREAISELGEELAALSWELDSSLRNGGPLPTEWERDGRKLSAEQLKVIEEALGDAYAYRTDSGEQPEEDLEDHEREACLRYQRLADQLGLTIQ